MYEFVSLNGFESFINWSYTGLSNVLFWWLKTRDPTGNSFLSRALSLSKLGSPTGDMLQPSVSGLPFYFIGDAVLNSIVAIPLIVIAEKSLFSFLCEVPFLFKDTAF